MIQNLHSLFTILISISLLLIIPRLLLSVKQFLKIKITVDFITYIFLVSTIFFYLLPALLRVFSNWEYVLDDNITYEEMSLVYLLEFISYIMWGIGIYLMVTIFNKGKPQIIKLSYQDIFKKVEQSGKEYLIHFKNSKLDKNQFLSFTMVICFMTVIIQFQFLNGEEQSILNSLDWLLLPLLKKTGPLISLFCFLLGPKYVGKFPFFIYLISTIIIFSSKFLSGSHGSIIAPVIYMFFFNLFIYRRKSITYIIILLLAIVMIFNEELHFMRDYYAGVKTASLGEKLELAVSADQLLSQENSFIKKIEWRFGANSRASVGYLRMVERGFYAGLNPIKNSLFAFLPRTFYKDKPQPGSVDGKKYGIGMYLMHKEVTGSWWLMSGFFTGLHYYWEGGILFLIIGSLFAGIYFGALLLFVNKISHLSLPFLMIVFDTWWQMPKLWISEIILHTVTFIGPLALIWVILSFIFKAGFVRKHNQSSYYLKYDTTNI
jgi:hypothetical protein